MLKDKMKITMALVAVLAICISAAVIGSGGSVDAEDAATTVGTHLDGDTGITFTLYSDGTAEATKVSGSPAVLTVPGNITVDDAEYTVTSVAGAFGYANNNIEQVTFAASIKELKDGGNGVFSRATKLKSVAFEEGSELTYIGNKAFQGCISLATMDLPEGLKEIGDGVFKRIQMSSFTSGTLYYNLYCLEELVLPASLEKIGDGSLPNLVVDIKLADGNTSFVIENGVLYDAEKTTLIRAFNPQGDIEIPSTVKTINSWAFNFQTPDVFQEKGYTSNNFKFTENPVKKVPSAGTVTIPSSVESIGEYAFSLYSVNGAVSTLPYKSLTAPSKLDADIGNFAFSYNPFVTEMYVAEGRTVAANAYTGCSNIKEAYILQKEITKQYQKIPAETLILSKDLTSMCSFCISEWTNLNAVAYEGVELETGVAKIPSTLVSIGGSSFKNAAFVKLDLSDYKGAIPNSVFCNLEKLEEIEFGDGIESIGQNSFQNLTSLTEVTFPSSLKTIGAYAFSGCKAIVDIDFGDNMESIGQYAFQNLTSLTEVTFPSSLKTIGNYAFKGCTAITDIDFGNGLESVGQYAFQNLTSLTEVTFPASLKTIDSNAFSGCKAIESIVVPETVTLADKVFPDSKCVGTEGNLKVLMMKALSDGRTIKMVTGSNILKEGNTYLDTEVTIPKEAISIASNALMSQYISKIILEEGNQTFVLDECGALYTKDMKTLISVKKNAIGDDGVFVLPDQVTSIADYCFYSQTGLKSIVLENSHLSTIGAYAFSSTSNLTLFTAPSTLEDIANNAFKNSGLTEADFSAIEDHVLSIGMSAFASSPISTVKFPTRTGVILGNSSFAATSLQTVRIESGELGSYVFNNCKNLEVVYLGSGVTKTSNDYVMNTPALKQIIIMNTDSEVIGKTIMVNHITSKGDFTIVVPEDSSADYSTFEAKYTISKIMSLKNGGAVILPGATDGITLTKGEVQDDAISFTYELDRGYDRSDVVIKLDETVIPVVDNGFTVRPSSDGSIQTIVVEGVEINQYSVEVKAGNATTNAGSTVVHGDDFWFNVIPDQGYVLRDLTAIIGDASYPAHHGSWIRIQGIDDDVVIELSGIVPESCAVTFIADGEIVGISEVGYGEKVGSNGASEVWYPYGSATPFDFGQPVTEDVLLVASTVSDDSKVRVDFYSARGSLTASWIGGEIDSGGSVLRGFDVTFTYDGEGSYSVVGWFIDGKFVETTDTSMTVSDISKPITVQMAVEYEQAGYKYIVNAPLILPDEEYAKMLWIGNYKDPLSKDYYSNMPSGYTVVGDYLYLVAGKELIRIDLNADFSNGMPANTLKVTPGSVNNTIDYYGGYIFNGTHVYDLDLNYLLDVSAAPVGMHDGAFVSLSNYRVTKYTIEKTDSGYEADELWAIVLEKHYGRVFMDGDYLYHLPVSTSSTDPDRAIQSIDLVNGEIKDTVNINQWQYGHYYDDGWLTVYDGWAYIASYTSGLFGETNPYVTARDPVLLRVAVEDGVFDKDSVQTMILPNNTQQSGLVVYNDRGYIHSGSQLVVIDMDTFTMIYKETGTKTHGGIVLNTYYATPENDYKVYIYIVPYAGAQTIWVYTDDQSKTEAGTPEKIANTGYAQYATTHVRTSASGYIYYYNDSSIFFIAGQKYHDVSFIADGEVVQTDSQAVNGTEISIPVAPERNGYTFVGWYNYDGTPVSEGAVVAGDMTVMAVYQPDVYKVVFSNDGDILQEAEYEYGEIPEYTGSVPTKSSTDRYSYAFKGWSPVISPVTGDTVYTAEFSSNVRMYTVTFVSDGSVVSKARYQYGASADGIIAPSVARSGYDFVSWTPAIADVTGNATYTAVWKAKENVDPDDKKDDEKEERTEVDLSKGESSFVVSTVDKPIDMKLPENTSAVILDPVSLKGKTVSADMKGIENTSSVKGTAYEFTMTVDGAGYNGKMHVTLPYEKVSGEKPVIYFVDGDKTEQMKIVSSTGSSVTFETDHNSVYVVSSEPESSGSGDDTMLYVCIAAVVLIAVVIAGVLIAKRRA